MSKEPVDVSQKYWCKYCDLKQPPNLENRCTKCGCKMWLAIEKAG